MAFRTVLLKVYRVQQYEIEFLIFQNNRIFFASAFFVSPVQIKYRIFCKFRISEYSVYSDIPFYHSVSPPFHPIGWPVHGRNCLLRNWFCWLVNRSHFWGRRFCMGQKSSFSKHLESKTLQNVISSRSFYTGLCVKTNTNRFFFENLLETDHTIVVWKLISTRLTAMQALHSSQPKFFTVFYLR